MLEHINDDPDKEKIWKDFVQNDVAGIVSYFAAQTGDWHFAKDIVADCLENACKQNPPPFSTRTKLRGYIYQSVRNRLINLAESDKVRKKHLAKNLIPPDYTEEINQTLETEAKREALKQRVREEIKALSPQRQQIIYLFFYKKMSRAEIAKKLNLAYTTVTHQRKLALKQLEDRLGADFFGDPTDKDDPE